MCLCVQIEMAVLLNPGCDQLPRHGDKAREMQLVEFRDYVAAAETLVSHNPLNLKRVAFVSSEDPDVIKEAARMRRIDTGAAFALCAHLILPLVCSMECLAGS